MPIPVFVATSNRAITNPITRRFAGRIPPFAIVEHRGRKSGKTFRTPVMVFPHGDEMVFALTYGKDVDWVKNVLAEGGCTIEYRRRRIALSDPTLSHGRPEDQPLPIVVRTVLRIIRVSDFLRLQTS